MDPIKNMDEYLAAYQKSLNNTDAFWNDYADRFIWQKKWNQVQSGDFKNLNVKWFEGGKLNLSENCLDRHLEKKGDQTALIYIPNHIEEKAVEISYKDLHQRVCKFANVLKNKGVKKGDRVIFYMGMVPELLEGILACTRIGAVHSVVFGGFSAKALAGRIQDCEGSILITNDGSYRGSKIVPLKEIADEALKTCPTIEKVLVGMRTTTKIEMKEGRDEDLGALLKEASIECAPESVDSEHPLFILYTSGSTGKPKGLQHTTAGYMNWAAFTFENVFQVGEGDKYWCTADIGWITGHTYLTYGPLLNGATTVMFEGVPTWPNAGRFWREVENHGITHFYTAPTAIRALQGCDIGLVKKHNLKSLKVLGTVGEPINEEAWHWYNEHIGEKRCPIVDTWWQTETGGIMISPLAGITETIPSYATQPLPAVEPVLMDPEGKELTESEAEGNLCIKRPWPGMARTIYGDHERYKETYFSTYPGYYFTGDGAKRDAKGNLRITGRVDDVLNVSGHRIGTAEVEAAITEDHQSHVGGVVEAAVVGFPHDIKGEGIYAYVIVDREGIDGAALKTEINGWITKEIGPIAKLDHIQIVSGLPKTRSGKIMRRILRKIAAGKSGELGDTSTLLNPEIVEELKSGDRF